MTKTPENKIIVAIDGYSSSGKSTMAKELAAKIGYRYIDSGAMYRAVTLFAMEHEMIGSDGSVDVAALSEAVNRIKIDFILTPQGQHTLLDGIDVEHRIRSLEVSSHVSPVAAIHAVRKALTARQQHFDTICRQVSGRSESLRRFAADHDVVLFVSGAKSSNGKVLCAECTGVNPRTHLIAGPEDIKPEWLHNSMSIGICGATSTPRWLMEDVKTAVSEILKTSCNG